MNRVALTIDSRPENVPLVGACVKEMADGYFSVAKLTEIEQAVTETVNNCIEHAYSGSQEQQIVINCGLLEDCLVIEIIDQGKQLNSECLMNMTTDFNYDPDDIDNLPEGGLGLKIIKSYMDKVNYRRENDHNHWSLTKYRSETT